MNEGEILLKRLILLVLILSISTYLVQCEMLYILIFRIITSLH